MSIKSIIEMDFENQLGLINYYEAVLEKLPEGSLYVVRRREKLEYYILDIQSGKRKYIKHSEQEYIASLKRRKYIDNGIMPGAHLFATADSKDGELDLKGIMSTLDIIKTFL